MASNGQACTILLSTITGHLITYIQDGDDPARIWNIVKDKFQLTTHISFPPKVIDGPQLLPECSGKVTQSELVIVAYIDRIDLRNVIRSFRNC